MRLGTHWLVALSSARRACSSSRCCFFFFKQNTAYEMFLCDWSSDVCSSDLVLAFTFPALRTIDSRLGLVVLGLDQGRISRHSVWNRSGLNPVCRNAAQPAAV